MASPWWTYGSNSSGWHSEAWVESGVVDRSWELEEAVLKVVADISVFRFFSFAFPPLSFCSLFHRKPFGVAQGIAGTTSGEVVFKRFGFCLRYRSIVPMASPLQGPDRSKGPAITTRLESEHETLSHLGLDKLCLRVLYNSKKFKPSIDKSHRR